MATSLKPRARARADDEAGTRAGWRVRVWAGGLLCVIGLLAPPLQAAQPLRDQFVETWTARDGLPHSTVHGIGQTADGYLWLATWEGIARYNGREFRLYRREDVPGLGDDGVRALHVGPTGDLWVASTRGGIARWHDGRWQARAPVDGLVTDLLDDGRGRLWVATARGGVIAFDAAGGRRSIAARDGLPSDTVNALVRDRRGRVWAATSHGLARIDGARARPVTGGLPEGPVFSLAADAGGGLLVGTEQGAWRGDGAAFAPLHPGLARDTATRLWRDPDGGVWVGTNVRGLAHVAGDRLEWLGSAGGLPNDRVLALRRDREGSLWIGTNGGLARLRAAPIHTYTRADGLVDDFVRTTLVARDGTVWVGSGRGLDRLDPGTGRVVPVALGAAGDVSVLSLAEDAAGDLLVGTFHHGVLRLRGGRVVETLEMGDGLPSNEVRALLAAHDGRLWIGTKQGLVVRDPQGLRVYGVAQGLPADYVQALHEDASGGLWAGTGLGAARVLDGRAVRVDLGASDAHYVYGFLDARDGRATWLATDRGLVRVPHAGGAVARIGRMNGLPFEKIFAVVRDRGGLWLTGNEGIVRIDEAALDRAAQGRGTRLGVQHFGRTDGMLSTQANGGSMPAAAVDAQGRLWVATAIGVARLDPAAIARTQHPLPPVSIEHFEIDGRSVDPRSRPELAPGDHRFVVRFVAPALLDAHRVRYRYRLDGAHGPWVELGDGREVQFSHLDPGAFRLELQAWIPGQPGRESATLAFAIHPYWWQRPAVWIALVIAALVGLHALVRLRLRHLRRSEQRLRRLVSERTAALEVQTQVAERLARTDALTMLANRRALDQALSHDLVDLAGVHPLCLLLLDVDGFKPINDLYSHAAGDLALKAVAEVLAGQARAQDVAARWGGDEFALLLVDCTLADGLAVGERLRAAVEAVDCEPFAPGLGISASIGVACSDPRAGGASPRSLVARADEALYRAKRSGKNRVCAAALPETA
ncbi:ligand-binding sensor domain-containing diguanylate cyclase [Lysobacter humi (ex Lee et al. 2017)]